MQSHVISFWIIHFGYILSTKSCKWLKTPISNQSLTFLFPINLSLKFWKTVLFLCSVWESERETLSQKWKLLEFPLFILLAFHQNLTKPNSENSFAPTLTHYPVHVFHLIKEMYQNPSFVLPFHHLFRQNSQTLFSQSLKLKTQMESLTGMTTGIRLCQFVTWTRGGHMQKQWWVLIWWCGGTGMRVLGRCLLILVLIGWLHYLKEGLISGVGCSVCTMVGALMALVTASSSLRHPQMALRY